MEFLAQYGLFLAKAVTVLVVLMAAAGFAIALGRRRDKGEGIEVTHLNERYERMTATLERAMLPKGAFKARRKAHKLAEKTKRKARERAARREKGAAPPAAGAPRRVFVIDFRGDLRASGIAALREEVTAILTLASERDEVVVRIENAGGMVHGHGLAASQLARLRDRGVPLTAVVDKVAASGGYMMACVADRILAAPFAILGSIGVLAQIPNVHRLLERHGVDFELIKGGEYKRTLTVFGKNTPEDREKMQRDVEALHRLFKDFVARYRSRLDIDTVSTGEHWYGAQALELRLVDELKTSDDYLLEAAKEAELYQVIYTRKQPLAERLALSMNLLATRFLDGFERGEEQVRDV